MEKECLGCLTHDGVLSDSPKSRAVDEGGEEKADVGKREGHSKAERERK